MEGVRARHGGPHVKHMLPVDVVAAVRALREIDFRGLTMFEELSDEVVGIPAAEAQFAPPALLANLGRAWRDEDALARVLSETWV